MLGWETLCIQQLLEKPTTNKKPLLKTKHMKFWLVLPEGMWETLKHSGRKFSDLRPKTELFVWCLVVAALCSSAAGLGRLMKIRWLNKCSKGQGNPWGKPAAVCKRTAVWEKIYFPVRWKCKKSEKCLQNNNVHVLESRPQSNQEFVAGLEKYFSLLVPMQLDRTWAQEWREIAASRCAKLMQTYSLRPKAVDVKQWHHYYVWHEGGDYSVVLCF